MHLNVATSIWPQEKPSDSAAVEIVFGQGKWESRVGQRLTHDSVFPVCTPALGEQIRGVDDLLRQRLFDLPGTLQSWDAWLEACGDGAQMHKPPVHRASTWAVSLEWALQGLGVALAHETVANDLIASGRLVRPVPFAMPMKEAYYLIAPEGSHTNAAAKAFKHWLLQEMRP